VLLNLLNEATPLIRELQSLTGSLLSPDYDESGEQILIVEYPIWHEVFTLLDHLQLCPVNNLYLPLHAAFIALTDDGNDEIHEYNVADNQNEEPENPCQDFEVFAALNYR
jgi:hypothetical protein